MKKKKIKKGIILLSMVMIIINTIFPIMSNAKDYTTGDLLYVIENGNSTNGQEIFSYVEENLDKIDIGVDFIKIEIESGEFKTPIGATKMDANTIVLYTSRIGTYPMLAIYNDGTAEYYTSGSNKITPLKISFYEIIEIIPTPSPSPTPDERVTNLLNETGNGVETILTWVGDLWEGITTGEMSAILPIFIIFIVIPLILLVIKIIRKSTWGD